MQILTTIFSATERMQDLILTNRLSVFFAAILLFFPLAAHPGGSAVVQTSGDTVHLSWRDSNTLRMQSPGETDYMILRDGKVYEITYEDGHPTVIDVGEMMKGFMTGLQEDASFMRLVPSSTKATGRRETVAGIQGKVYEVTATNAHGRKEMINAVLTSSALATELTDSYLHMIEAMYGSAEVRNAFIHALPEAERGILRFGDDWAVISISEKTPAASDFVLPAKVTKSPGEMPSLQQLQEMMERSKQQGR